MKSEILCRLCATLESQAGMPLQLHLPRGVDDLKSSYHRLGSHQWDPRFHFVLLWGTSKAGGDMELPCWFDTILAQASERLDGSGGVEPLPIITVARRIDKYMMGARIADAEPRHWSILALSERRGTLVYK